MVSGGGGFGSGSAEGGGDPITELLLSQLGGLRRPPNASAYTSTLAQIHQLQQVRSSCPSLDPASNV